MNITGKIAQPNNTVVIDGSTLRPQRGEPKPLDLRTGSSIQGTVVSVSDTEGGKVATINVGDTVISAKLQEDMGLREGQTLNFAVKSNGPGGVSITPLYANTSVDQSTLKALMAAGIEVNRDTVQMVKDMMEAGLPIDKNSLLSMNRSLNMHPNNSIATLVEMKSLNIPITDNNITQFESYKNYQHQVTSAMEDIMNELPKAFSELSASGNTEGALKLYGDVLKLFSQEYTSGENTAEGTAAEGTVPGKEVAEAAQEKVLQEDANAQSKKTVIKQEDVLSEQNGVKGQNAQVEETPLKEQATVTAKSQNETISANGKEIPEAVKSADTEANQATAQTKTVGRNVLTDEFVKNLKDVGVSEETIKEYENALKEARTPSRNAEGEIIRGNTQKLEAAQKQVLKELAENFEKSNINEPAEADAWKKVFSGKEYNKLLKDNISSQWLLKPGDVQNRENVENLYQRLNNQVRGLTNAINQNLGAESKLFQSANNLQNNLDFMNQLNQMFQYVQLPLQMAGQNANGDLYVYRNKNKKLSDDGSVSAVLHLDMEHLGPVDVYVKLKDTKVSTNFYVADDDILGLINDNIHILNERLEKRGYSMTAKLMLHDDMDGQDAAVDEMLSVSKKPILSTASFDARA